MIYKNLFTNFNKTIKSSRAGSFDVSRYSMDLGIKLFSDFFFFHSKELLECHIISFDQFSTNNVALFDIEKWGSEHGQRPWTGRYGKHNKWPNTPSRNEKLIGRELLEAYNVYFRCLVSPTTSFLKHGLQLKWLIKTLKKNR